MCRDERATCSLFDSVDMPHLRDPCSFMGDYIGSDMCDFVDSFRGLQIHGSRRVCDLLLVRLRRQRLVGRPLHV